MTTTKLYDRVLDEASRIAVELEESYEANKKELNLLESLDSKALEGVSEDCLKAAIEKLQFELSLREVRNKLHEAYSLDDDE